MRPQTIQIFLPDGSPTGVREAELTNRLIKAIHFPRTAMEKASKRDLVKFTGVYFLFGEENGVPKVYIGEGEVCWDRITSHHRNKDFWTEAVICVTKTNIFTKSELKFLEHTCLKAALESGRYEATNDIGSKMPSIPESRIYDLLDNFDTIKTLIGALGFQVFRLDEEKQESEKEYYYCKGKDAHAKAEYTEEGVWVLEGSIANLKESKTAGNWVIGLRKTLMESGHLVSNGNNLIFAKKALFKSVSGAAAALARRANGWIEWKDEKGRTLDELKRK